MNDDFVILPCDCRDAMRLLMEPQSVNCVVTSPPYFGLRDYGVAGQIGLEPSPDEFVAAIVDVFRHVRRVLRDDGTVWLNLGDSYCRNPAKGGSGRGGKNDYFPGYGEARKAMRESAKAGSSDGAVRRAERPGLRSGDLGEKQLLGIPWRVAFALQADGWLLRQDIIWHKPNPMPESVRDRCTKAHEYIFLLSKSARYYFDSAAMAEPAIYAGKRPSAKQGELGGKGPIPGTGQSSFRAIRDTRNRRSVWTVPTKPFRGAHFATFPPDLIEPCVLAGCPVGGTVYDPFGGSGTTAVVALRNGRKAVLSELNPEYVEIARARLAADK